MQGKSLRIMFLMVPLCAVPFLLLNGSAFAQSASATNTTQQGVQPPGTEYPCNIYPCLFYAGDFDPNGPNPNGLWDQVANFGVTIDGTAWVPFQIPKKEAGAKGKTDWNVTGLFANMQNFPSPSATQATWSIVQGVSEGGNPGGVKVFCSGTSPVTTTATGRFAFNFYTEYTYLVTGISTCPTLDKGVYWMTLVPQPSQAYEQNYLSDVEDNSPPNIQGPGTEPVDNSFFTSTFFGFSNFTAPTNATLCGTVGCDAFSVGVIGVATK